MAVIEHNSIKHEFAPNPRIQENGLWSVTYPPIEADTPYLRNKFTGEIVPNIPDYARRSDILEPYYQTEEEKTELKPMMAAL